MSDEEERRKAFEGGFVFGIALTIVLALFAYFISTIQHVWHFYFQP